ncbi:hypothetical protein Aduo_015743 [Ancylostoma duodenale]
MSRRRMQARALQKYGLPSIVGAIDGTHVKIMAPHEREQWPGRSHDSRVFRESELHRRLVNGELDGRIVGDSAYRAESFLIKIFLEVT